MIFTNHYRAKQRRNQLRKGFGFMKMNSFCFMNFIILLSYLGEMASHLIVPPT